MTFPTDGHGGCARCHRPKENHDAAYVQINGFIAPFYVCPIGSTGDVYTATPDDDGGDNPYFCEVEK